MGVSLDPKVNKKIHSDEAVINNTDSKVKVVALIPTDEEFMIASDTV